MSAYATSMAALDPNLGQLVELPIDQSGAYVIQDASSVLSSGQIQLGGIQGGKSLLKPELAQHLNQHPGYKTAVGRGGFTLTNDPRWVNLNSGRGSRNISRKPLGSSGTHLQTAALGISQSAALAPAASGLLSLGSRYTPSSATAFTTNSGSLSGGNTGIGGAGSNVIASAAAAPGSLVSANVGTLGGMGVDRDAGYRLAAAIAGTSGRGRPRGRRPLRGQFPVVPIDMVRQLGIEQQVILQPAAPVAMRNKAVLCRPLSMCRKTQASVIQYENTNHEGIAVQTEDSKQSSENNTSDILRYQKETQTQEVASEILVKEPVVPDVTTQTALMQTELEYSTVETSTLDDITFNDLGTQTDAEDERPKAPLVLPIPVPVPIYVPVPVCLYARPVPFALPFPLPCPFILPLVTKEQDQSQTEETKESTTESHSEDEQTTISHQPDEIVTEESQQTEESECLVIAEPVSLQKTEETIVSSSDRYALSGHKRPAPSDSPKEASNTSVPESTAHAPDVKVTQSESAHTRTQWEASQPPPKRPRPNFTPMLISDANYHLKFSYGINAWRHWVQQKINTIEKNPGLEDPRSYSHLYTDLLSMSESDLNTALSQFVREVRKPNNECYVADSIFYLCLGIQEYLNENNRKVNLFGGIAFRDLSRALDEILANFQPRISPDGLLICRIEEEHLWEAQQLGSQSPEILLFTMLYYNTKHFGLRLGTAHRQLAFSYFQVTDSAILCHLPCIMFGEPGNSVTTLHLDMNHHHPARCPVRLFKAYVSKCPPEKRNSDSVFYLVPQYPPTPDCWYSTDPMPPAELQIILNRIKMVKEIQEAFMNGQPDGGF